MTGAIKFKFLVILAVIVNKIAATPNIVVILTDDQDLILKSLRYLPKINKIFNEGANFLNAFTSSPICCPSRSAILSGRYAHNTQTFNNSRDGGCYSENWIEKHEPQSFPAKLHESGYETFYAGKYLNEYNSKKVPIGYDQFFGLHGNSKYYNYTLNENGEIFDYGDSPEDYLTTVIKEKTLEFISNQTHDKPFFAMLSVPAAHAPYTPEEKYKDLFINETISRSKNFNVGTKPFKKHWLMTMKPEVLPDEVIATIDEYYHMRLESLLTVDDLVEDVYQQLGSKGLLDNTYLIFTSDNGYHLGQWAMPYDKRLPYETDIRVPLLVRGPNVVPKSVFNSPVLLIDLAPTILNLAKVPIHNADFDGIPFDSLLSSVNLEEVKERQMLIEYWGEGNAETYNSECPYHKSQRLNGCTLDAACKCQDSWNNTYSCVRDFGSDINFLFCTFQDHECYQEAYYLDTDFWQMENVGFDILTSEQARYQIMIENLKQCQGDTCRKVK